MRQLLALAIVLLPSFSWGAIAVVQHKRNSSSVNSTDVVVTVTSTTAKLIVVGAAKSSGSDSVSSVTDNIGNSYVQATNARSTIGAATTDIWYCLNASAGVTAVTTHWALTNTNNKQSEVWEVSGYTTPAFDVANHGSAAGSGNVVTGATVTTTSTAGFAAAYVVTSGSIDQNPNSGNECTAGGDIEPSTVSAACSILPVTAASHGAAWHDTSATPNECNSIAAFKESGVSQVTRHPVTF